MNRNVLIGLCFGLAAALIWGGQAVVARSGTVAGYSPLDLAVLRYGAAALVLLPFAWRARHVLAKISLLVRGEHSAADVVYPVLHAEIHQYAALAPHGFSDRKVNLVRPAEHRTDRAR